jgi:hypothetical protein
MVDAVCQGTERRFAEAIERLYSVRFVNLINDGGHVHGLNSILCLFIDRQERKPLILLALRDNINATIHDDCQLFSELMTIMDSFGFVLCSVAVDNLPAPLILSC